MSDKKELEKKSNKAPFYEYGQFMGQEPSAHNRAARIQMRSAFMPDVRGQQKELKKGQIRNKSNIVYPEEQGDE